MMALGAAEALTVSYLDGLWLVLIGWFLISAATAERKAATAQAALAGVRVAEVMTPDPQLAPGWHTVAEFAAEAARSRQDVFPVVGFGGELTGVVLASQFDDIPASDRARLRVDKMALEVPALGHSRNGTFGPALGAHAVPVCEKALSQQGATGSCCPPDQRMTQAAARRWEGTAVRPPCRRCRSGELGKGVG